MSIRFGLTVIIIMIVVVVIDGIPVLQALTEDECKTCEFYCNMRSSFFDLE
jgi:hypothetical protein